MAPMPSLKFGFEIPYRGGTKFTSTKFHFNGGTPSSDAEWLALWSAMWTDLRLGIAADVLLTNVNGYPNDTSPSAYVWVGSSRGSFDRSADLSQAAINCALLSWTTDARNSRGGPVYLRNFIHCVTAESETDLDTLLTAQLTPLNAFAAKFDDAGAGYSDGTNTHKRAGPNGAVGLVGTCESKLTRRVLARRG